MWKNQGILEKEWRDFSNLKHLFRNIQFVMSMLYKKFSLQQPQQH